MLPSSLIEAIETKLVRVCAASKCLEGRVIEVRVEGKVFALANVDGKFYCLGGPCTHAGAPLGEGSLKGFTLTCPWHCSQFDVRTEETKQGPAKRPVAIVSYP